MNEASYFPPMFWLGVAQIIVTSGLALYVFISNRNKATAGEIQSNNQRITDIDKAHGEANHIILERVAKLEGAYDHLPTAEQLADLRAAVANGNGQIKAVDTRINSIELLLQQVSKTTEQLLQNELAEGRNNKTKGGR